MSLLHKIALTMIDGVGHITAKNLLGHFETAERVFLADRKSLLGVPGIGEITAEEILKTDALRRAEKELNFINKHHVDVLFFDEDRYPRRLMECADAPILLYYKGTADLNHLRIISIVGTRRATEYGRYLCRQLAETLAGQDVIIVSGLAYGIDVAAHKESLNHDIPTLGVLAHGLDRIYPAIHQPLSKQMVLNGGLITEFPLYTNPDRENFPKRNRIIAGIADATVVVEATSKGGALITADIANSYSRDVYAFPGRINDQYSEGCNFLIKTNRAGLINHAKDLIYYMGWDDKKLVPRQQMVMPMGLEPEEDTIIKHLIDGGLRIDELSAACQIQQSRMAIHLLSLEMKGLISVLPGKLYKLNT